MIGPVFRDTLILIAAVFALVGPVDADYVGGLDPAGDNYLSLRAGPGLSYREMRRVESGTLLTVIGRRDNWRKVRLDNGATGWVFGKYIMPGLPPEVVTSPPPEEEGATTYDIVEPDTPVDPAQPEQPAAPVEAEATAPSAPAVSDDGATLDAIIEDIGHGLAPAP
jgi:hypothetical protein